MFRFLKSLFVKPKPIHICEFKLINISGSALYNGKYEWCEGCGSMRSPYVLNNNVKTANKAHHHSYKPFGYRKGKLIFRPTIPSSFITKKDGL